MSKKYVSVLKDSAATPGYRIIAPEDYVYTENGTKKVKKIDSKADKKVPATAGNLATLDSSGNLADSGKQTTDFMNALTTAYEASGSATKTVTKVTQAKTGAVAVTYSDIQSGTTSQKGLVQLEDSTSSTSTTKAATPNSVKSAYDLANGKYSKPSGGIPSTDMTDAVQTSLGKADSAIQGVKLNGSTLTPSSAKVVDLGNLKTKQTAVSDPSASGTTITAIATISQDANGVITATKKTIQSASQSQDGVMSAADKKKLDGIATGAEVNQNAFSNVKVGDVTVAADTKTDTLTLAAGSNVTITPDATNDKITIAAKDTTYTADAGIRLDGTVFKHTNSVSGGTVGPTTDTAGATLSVPYVTYDSQGHVTASGTRTHNVGTASTSGAGIVQLQDSIDATTTKAATPNAVKKAIEALDVASVGGSGKYISAISETDGKISATATSMDTTPTASSSNAVTSGGVKAALDDISADVYSWYRTGNGNGSVTTYKVCSISNFGTNNWTGFRFVFDYIMEYNSSYAASTGSVEIKVRTQGTSEPDYYIAVRPDGGKKSTGLRPEFSLYKNWTDNKLRMILCVTVGGSMYNGISMRIHGCMNQSGTDYAGLVSMATNTVYAGETGYTEATLSGYLTYKTVSTNDSAVGTTSVPVYVNGDGAVTACTDDFVHDADVTSTYSSTGTAPVNGTAVAAAINALDVTDISGFGAGKTLATLKEENGKISATFQNISITKSQVSDFSHTHGNIQNGGTLQTNDITIANGDKLVVTDSSDSSKVARASISFDGSTTTQALTKAGTWATFNNYSLPLAASGTRGGIQIGYSESGTNYAVKLSSEKAYVTVPWTDTKQNITLATTTKAFITGVSTTPTGTAQALTGLADTGVYLTTTAGELNATQYKVNEHCTMKYNSTKSSLDFTFA